MSGDKVPRDYIDPKRDENVYALFAADRIVTAFFTVPVFPYV
jgi:hypothetical protein